MNAMAIVRVEEGQCGFRLGFFFLKCHRNTKGKERSRRQRTLSVRRNSLNIPACFAEINKG